MFPDHSPVSDSRGPESAIETRLANCATAWIDTAGNLVGFSAHRHLIVKTMVLQHQLIGDKLNAIAILVNHVAAQRHHFGSHRGLAGPAVAALKDEAISAGSVVVIGRGSQPRPKEQQPTEDE